MMSEPAGLKVYLKNGFRVVDEVGVDYGAFGGREKTVHYFLVREPVVVSGCGSGSGSVV